MPTLIVDKTYLDGVLLLTSDLDAFTESIEDFINDTKLDDDNIQADGITASTKIINASVINAKMASDSVDTSQLIDDSVTKVKLAVDVAGEGLAQNVDGSLEISPDDVGVELNASELRLKDGGVTVAKQGGRDEIAYTSTPATPDEVAAITPSTSLVVNPTTTQIIPGTNIATESSGRPILFEAIAGQYVAGYSSFTSSPYFRLYLYVSTDPGYSGETIAAYWWYSIGPGYLSGPGVSVSGPSSVIKFIHTGTVDGSTYYFRMKAKGLGTGFTLEQDTVKLVAYEI